MKGHYKIRMDDREEFANPLDEMSLAEKQAGAICSLETTLRLGKKAGMSTDKAIERWSKHSGESVEFGKTIAKKHNLL